MSTETKVPALPEPPQGASYSFLTAVKQAVEIRLGLRGDPLDRAVTLRELFSSGVVVGTSGGVSAPVSSDSAWGYALAVPPVDLTPPPAATSLTSSATWSQIFLTWDWSTYSNHDVTEVWRRQVGTDPSVDYTTCEFDGVSYSDGCQMVASPSGKVWQDNVTDIVDANGDGQQYYYWVRLKSTAGVTGDPYPVATQGVLGTLTKDPAHALALLNDSLTEAQLTDEAIITRTLAADAVTANKIIAGAVTTDKIFANAITADKILAGAVTANKLLATDIYSVTMQSTNYSAGTAGWNINKDGNAEFNSGTFRGTLNVKSATSGARMEMTNSTLRVYDSSGTLRVKIGDLA